MANSVLVLGNSGSGKSTSLRNLISEETMIINTIGKPLPFRGARSKYKPLSSDGLEGNYYASDDPKTIRRIINLVNTKRPEIKQIVLDDFGYTITNSFMRKASQKGYDRFIEIAKDTFDILEAVNSIRDDLYCFVMMHTEIDSQGVHRCKTVGKMIDQYICIEGKFSTVLHTVVSDGGYFFLTNFDGQHLCKTPLGAFDQLLIDNDLQLVKDTLEQYSQ